MLKCPTVLLLRWNEGGTNSRTSLCIDRLLSVLKSNDTKAACAKIVIGKDRLVLCIGVDQRQFYEGG